MGEDDGIERKENGDCPAARFFPIRDNQKGKDTFRNGFLEDALKAQFPEAITSIYMGGGSPDLVVFVDTEDGLYQFATSSKNIFSSSIFGFIAWMVGISLLLFLVAVLFLRIQVRSIADLATAAEDFGKGVDNKNFKPYGSSEVRRAGIAFIKMKERIQRQISERTQMLAGVSHDLRTPLTRMKLQLAMLPDGKSEDGLNKEEFLQDVDEMEKMLEGYLSFVSGEGGEPSGFVDMNEMILSILNKFRNSKALIRYTTNDQVSAIRRSRADDCRRCLQIRIPAGDERDKCFLSVKCFLYPTHKYPPLCILQWQRSPYRPCLKG